MKSSGSGGASLEGLTSAILGYYSHLSLSTYEQHRNTILDTIDGTPIIPRRSSHGPLQPRTRMPRSGTCHLYRSPRHLTDACCSCWSKCGFRIHRCAHGRHGRWHNPAHTPVTGGIDRLGVHIEGPSVVFLHMLYRSVSFIRLTDSPSAETAMSHKLASDTDVDQSA